MSKCVSHNTVSMAMVTYKLEETVQNMKIRKLTKKPAIYRMTSDNKKNPRDVLKEKIYSVPCKNDAATSLFCLSKTIV